MRIRRAGFIVATVIAGALTPPSRAAVQYLGSTYLDGHLVDASGLRYTLENGYSANALDGVGSGIAYTGVGHRYLLLPDRGPNNTYAGGAPVDDTTSYLSRFHTFDIIVAPSGGAYQVFAGLAGTTLLANESGQNFVGLSSQFTSIDPTQNLRMDSESIRVAPDHTIYISDEYGPSIYHFSADGTRLDSLPVPEKFHVPNPSPLKSTELAINTVGRVANKGLEGLAITPDGSHLLAAMQAPLIQDGGDNTRYTRMLLFDLHDQAAPPKEFLYKLDADAASPFPNASKTGVSDMVAINDHEFLVDERDGSANKIKYAYKIDITGAQDISGIDSLSALSPADLDSIQSINKSPAPLLDLKALTSGLLNSVPTHYKTGLPDKIEGFAFGPDLPDGRHLLLVTNDNDFVPSSTTSNGYPNYILAFAIDPTDIPNFQQEIFASVPEPRAALALLLTFVLRCPNRRRRRQIHA